MKRFLIKLFCFLVILGVLFYLEARYLNPTFFKVQETPIYNKHLDSNYNGFKIAQFSDLLYGSTINEEELKKTVKELNLLNADIVIFNGDLFADSNISKKEQKLIIKYLKDIKARSFKLAVIGDYDKKYLDTYKNILTESNFILLDNTNKLVYNNSNIPLNFIGLTNLKNIEELYNNEYFNITITHYPDNIKKITNSKIVFAGHSLGGSIRIPFIGGILKPKGATTYTEEYYKVNNTTLLVSKGLGSNKSNLRFLNKPTIYLYRLYNK